MMIRAALCYSLQPTFGQLQLSESLTKTFWYKYCPPWFKAVESYKSGPGKSQPLPFSPWPAHMKMAFLPLGLKTFYLKQLLFPWLLRCCEILFFLFECVWFCGGLVFTPRCILNLFLCCVRVVCVCVLCMYMHTHTSIQMVAQIVCLGTRMKVRGQHWVLVLAIYLDWGRISNRSPLYLQEQLQLQGILLFSPPILLQEH